MPRDWLAPLQNFASLHLPRTSTCHACCRAVLDVASKVAQLHGRLQPLPTLPPTDPTWLCILQVNQLSSVLSACVLLSRGLLLEGSQALQLGKAVAGFLFSTGQRGLADVEARVHQQRCDELSVGADMLDHQLEFLVNMNRLAATGGVTEQYVRQAAPPLILLGWLDEASLLLATLLEQAPPGGQPWQALVVSRAQGVG